uniref:AAA+ ATPase domain-containing protein n=1 Tax=Lactuca sativa TaxID=4236 RepID=A0A9R1WMI5_LACSA|nr:hypothetical protein LSAT_V11C100047530 [Lactuca sativa]
MNQIESEFFLNRLCIPSTPQGMGKTTLVARVLENLRTSYPNLKIQGFFTQGERVGFEVVMLDGRTTPLASINNSSVESNRWSTMGRYRVDVASFELLAFPELQVKEDTDLFVIDEVGKMELFSSLFFPAVLRVLESKKINLWWLFLPTVNRREREREERGWWEPCILNFIYLFIYFKKSNRKPHKWSLGSEMTKMSLLNSEMLTGLAGRTKC